MVCAQHPHGLMQRSHAHRIVVAKPKPDAGVWIRSRIKRRLDRVKHDVFLEIDRPPQRIHCNRTGSPEREP